MLITTMMAGFAFGYCVVDLMMSVAYKIEKRKKGAKM